MSATSYLDSSLLARKVLQSRAFVASGFFFLALVLSLAAIAADQLAAPILRTTAPLWATLALLLLLWRRDDVPQFTEIASHGRPLSVGRLAVFISAHLALVLLSRSLGSTAQPFSGSATAAGTLVALGKLAVLAPTFFLLPFGHWKRLVRVYKMEAIAALVALAVNVPRRVLEFVWPWYGPKLGWVVYLLARNFVPGLAYDLVPEPTIIGPHQDTSLVLLCSGIGAFELLSWVFGIAALLDWNRLRKGRAFLVYLGCLISLLACNVFRIAILVVVGNLGFANFVTNFHVTAGSIFFCLIFLVYISLTYRWMTQSQASQA